MINNLVEIFTKDEFDSESEKFSNFLKNALSKNTEIKFSKIYRISLNKNSNYFKRIADEILIDPIVEIYRLNNKFYGAKPLNLSRYDFSVDVWFKEGITDVVGESVKNIITDCGFTSPDKVSFARRFYFSDINKKQAEEFINENFANKLINDIMVTDLK
jgi:phosphoribosylformylglycinamidine (FGAM) synthase PurS component